MNRKIIFYENHFIDFYKIQNHKVKTKIKYVFELIKQVDRIPEKFLKHITGTKGLYEIRIESESNIFRIFCCFDDDQLEVLFNAFQKKTQKTRKSELDKALNLLDNYLKGKK